jgi:hypothetical protein
MFHISPPATFSLFASHDSRLRHFQLLRLILRRSFLAFIFSHFLSLYHAEAIFTDLLLFTLS